MVSVTHTKVSAKSDGADTALVRPSDWNASHTVTYPSGAVLQSKSVTYTSTTALSNVIPFDDTKPQINEGTEILSLAIILTSSNNKVRVTATGWGSNTSAADNSIYAIFQGGSSLAINAGCFAGSLSNTIQQGFATCFDDSPGVLGSVTYSVRVGPAITGPVIMNGGGSGRFFGGASATVLVLEELSS